MKEVRFYDQRFARVPVSVHESGNGSIAYPMRHTWRVFGVLVFASSSEVFR